MLRVFLISVLCLPLLALAEYRLDTQLDNQFDTYIEQLSPPLNRQPKPELDVKGRHQPELLRFEELNGLHWQPLASQGGNLGIIHSAKWLRISINNPTDNESWLLVLNNRGLNIIDGWLQTDNGLQTFRMGALLKTHEGRELSMPRLNAKLTIPKHSSAELYLLLTHNGFADLNGTILSLDYAIEKQFSGTIAEVLFYGVFLTLFVYHLILLVTTRNKSYLVYCLFIFSTVCFFSFAEGYLWFVLPSWPNLVYAVGHGSIGLISASASLFTLFYLDLSKLKLARQVLWVVVFIGFAVCIARLFFWGFPALVIGGVLAVVTFLGIPIISLISYIKFKEKLALVYLLSWSLWSLIAVAIVLTVFNVLLTDLSDFWSILKAAFALQSFIFAWSLGYRIRALYLDKTRAVAENSAKSDLLTQVSHEIRTPMNGIIGTSQLLESHLNTDEAHYLNETIFHSGLSLLTVINDLLDLSRLDSGKVEICLEPTTIQTLIHQVELTLQAQLKQKGLSLTIDVSENTPEVVEIDGARLRQILFNIIGNAIKYTTDGGIDIRLTFDDGLLSILVKDTGRGIPSDKLEKIFTPYEQVKNTARELRTGTGLGLHIARSLVELMGGSIALSSQETVGTEVQIKLPTKALQQAPNLDIAPLVLGKSLKILIVDDNQVNRTVITGLFKNLGHTCMSANNGVEAVNCYFEKHEDIDCVFMDCEMPVMDGYTAAMKIREIELAKHLPSKPIIAVTAHAYSGHELKVRSAGMDDQVSKPITRESISLALNQLYCNFTFRHDGTEG